MWSVVVNDLRELGICKDMLDGTWSVSVRWWAGVMVITGWCTYNWIYAIKCLLLSACVSCRSATTETGHVSQHSVWSTVEDSCPFRDGIICPDRLLTRHRRNSRALLRFCWNEWTGIAEPAEYSHQRVDHGCVRCVSTGCDNAGSDARAVPVVT